MLQTVPYTREELLRERREWAVRALIRAIGYALYTGRTPHDVGRFIYESHRETGEFDRMLREGGHGNALAHLYWHVRTRCGWCDRVAVRTTEGGYLIDSASLLRNQSVVMQSHGVTRLDVESCLETVWRLAGGALGIDFAYEIGDEDDRAVIRAPGSAHRPQTPLSGPLHEEELPELRRMAVATGITLSIGYARAHGAEPEELGAYFYRVWDGAGYYEGLRERWGYGNALAYASSLAQARQVLYAATSMQEDLDGYTIASPSWGAEYPQVMRLFGVLPDDIHRYFAGGGVHACDRLGLQYQDRSDDRTHRVWIRAK